MGGMLYGHVAKKKPVGPSQAYPTATREARIWMPERSREMFVDTNREPQAELLLGKELDWAASFEKLSLTIDGWRFHWPVPARDRELKRFAKKQTQAFKEWAHASSTGDATRDDSLEDAVRQELWDYIRDYLKEFQSEIWISLWIID